VSRSGIIPISKTQDTAGPFARTVTDAAILLGALTGIDKDDDATNESKGKSKQDYTKFLDRNGLQGKRIGIEKSLLKRHERIDDLLSRSLEQMKDNGAVILEVEFMSKYHDDESSEFEILKYEFKDGLNRYLASANGKMKSLQDIINFNKQNEANAMPYFKQEIFDSSQVKGGLESKEYLESIEKLRAYRSFVNDMMQKNQLSALCGPATGPSWCIDFVNGDFWTGYGAYSPAAVTGYPSITVPMGFVEGLPIGISFLGKAYSEPELLAIAYAYEQVSKNRKMPGFINTLKG
jgi:amidase